MRMYRKVQDIMLPRTIYSEHTHGRYENEGLQALEKNLPFLDATTGLKNRMIIRDPITGLGELPDEWNPLETCHIERMAQPQRDPIRMEGEIGQEYNCLNTTKELKCKPREDRDPIRLQGDLGKEYDPLRPHGGLPRSNINRTPQRNPITGVGDFSSEPEFFPSSKRKGASNQQTYMRTDPITHSIPERGSATRHSMRQFNERWIMRDPIRHKYGDDQVQAEHRPPEMRHYAKNGPGQDLFYNSAKDISSYSSATLPTRRPYVRRNPITGEGMRPEDYSDTVPVLSAYYFRHNPIPVQHASPVKPVSKPITTKQPRPSRSPTRAVPSHTRPKQTQPAAKSTTQKPPPVKKVIRPKRPATVERTGYVRASSSDDRGSHTSERMNGTKPEQQAVPVRKPIKKPVTEAQPKSFFEEAQMATNGTLDEMHAPSHRTDSLTTPDYSEASQSVTNEDHEKSLELTNNTVQQYEPEQYPETTPNIPVEENESHTTKLGQAVAGSLYEELQAYDQVATMEPTDPMEAGHQKSSVPLFMNAEEEEDSPPPERAKSIVETQDQPIYDNHHGETMHEPNSPTPDHAEESLTESPVHQLADQSFDDYTPRDETAATHSEPEDTQSLADSIEQSNKTVE